MTPLLRLGPLGRQLGRASIDPTRPPPGGRLAHRGRPAYPPSPDRARRWRRERLARHLHLAAASMKPNPGRDRPALPPDRALTDPTRLPLGGHPVRRGRQPCPASLDRARRWRRERLARHVHQAVASMKPNPGPGRLALRPDRASTDPTRLPLGGHPAHRGRPAYPPSLDRVRRWRRERLAHLVRQAVASMKPRPGRDRLAHQPDRASIDLTRPPLVGHPAHRGRPAYPPSLDRVRRWRRERLAHLVRQAVASMKPRPGRDHPAHQPDRASIDLTKPRLGGHLVRRGRHRRHQAHQLAARPEVFASTIVLSALAADCVRQPEGGSSSRPHPAAPPVRRAHRRRRAAGAYQAGQR